MSEKPDWFRTWGEMQEIAARVRHEFYGTAYARTLATEQLKSMWDRYDGADSDIGDARISGEAVHAVLNERGEGDYCAV